jgi:hypothetical protein
MEHKPDSISMMNLMLYNYGTINLATNAFQFFVPAYGMARAIAVLRHGNRMWAALGGLSAVLLFVPYLVLEMGVVGSESAAWTVFKLWIAGVLGAFAYVLTKTVLDLRSKQAGWAGLGIFCTILFVLPLVIALIMEDQDVTF